MLEKPFGFGFGFRIRKTPNLGTGGFAPDPTVIAIKFDFTKRKATALKAVGFF